jgi:ubiquinone/menaquinone biosynthesis C-methylase UbiE
VLGASLLNIASAPDALVAEAVRVLKPGGTVSYYHPNGTMNRANAQRLVREKSSRLVPPRFF